MNNKKVYLGLGSNLGDRKKNLELAISSLEKILNNIQISFLYETPALLPENAASDWNKPFLNLAVSGYTSLQPHHLLMEIKNIEARIGRTLSDRWAPRIIDIDILHWENLDLQTQDLTIPHTQIKNRAFVLDPLKDIDLSFLKIARQHPQHTPIWMAILNLTPDSFSDGGTFVQIDSVKEYIQDTQDYVDIYDLGAESTRPGAQPLSWQEEWQRLEPVLKLFSQKTNQKLRPKISVDTRHAAVAMRALEYGVDIINDVSGKTSDEMLDILKNSTCQYVLMHSLTIPANPHILIPQDVPAIKTIFDWCTKNIRFFKEHKINLERIILDPGIGFNKNSIQSLNILRNIQILNDLPCRYLIGHSRKSFMKDFTDKIASERDLESIGISLALAQKGVDILRVHNPKAHIQAFRAFQHLL